MSSRNDCIRWYGERDGNRIADHWKGVLKLIRENPTQIVIPPPAKPYCMDCGSENIEFKANDSNVQTPSQGE